MTACVLALTALVAAGGLRVETGTPAALCPDIGEVRRAVRERLNVEGGGEWLASYDLVHRPEAQSGDVVRVELRDPAGRLRLRRDLPRSGESCVALAQAVALVLESFFRHPTEQPRRRRSRRAVRRRDRAAAPARPAALGWGPALDLLGAWAVGPSGPALAVDVWYGAGAVAMGLRCGGRLDGDRAAADHRPPGLRTGDRRRAQHAVSWLGGAPPARRRAGRDPARAGAGAGDRSLSAGQRAQRDVQRPGGAGGRGQGAAAAAAGVTGRAVAGCRARCHAAAPWPGGSRSTGCRASCSPFRQLRLFVGAGFSLVLFP